MSTQPTQSVTLLPPPTSTPLDMPASPFSARSKRKAHAQDENAAASRIPVKSPTSALTASTCNARRSPNPRKRSPARSLAIDKSSIPFPKNSIPAPAVVTPLLVDALCRVNAKSEISPRIGKRPRQSISTESKPLDTRQPKHKIPSATGPSVWKTLVSSGKGVIAETMDRDRE